MKEYLLQLKETEDKLANIVKEIQEKKVSYESLIKDLVETKSVLESKVTSLKQAINPLALAEFIGTGSKKLEGGVGIRSSKKIKYDPAKALDFAKEKDMFLTLDVKAFESAAPKLGLTWVTVDTVHSVTFPKVILLD